MADRIRFATPDDAPGILAIYAPYCESTAVSFESVAPSAAQMRERVEQISAEYPWLVCESDTQVAGYAYASRHRERAAYRWTVDVAVYVAKAHHRRNVGRALYASLLSILCELGYVRAYAGITLPNPASVGLHEAVGFSQVAVFRGEGYKQGEWRDVVWLERTLQVPDGEPAEPRGIGIVRNAEVVVAALEEGERLLRPRQDARG